MRSFATGLAMLGPVGLIPGPRATYGSFVVCVLWFFMPVSPQWIYGVLLLPLTMLAVWAAGEAEHALGHDANAISIDELVGQSITLLFVPHTLFAYGLAFGLFRLFDIWKPLGANEAQKLPGGWGVVADDVVAGVVACGAFHGIVWLVHRYALPLPL